MSDVVYVSKSQIERRKGPVRIAHLSGESQPVCYVSPFREYRETPYDIRVTTVWSDPLVSGGGEEQLERCVTVMRVRLTLHG